MMWVSSSTQRAALANTGMFSSLRDVHLIIRIDEIHYTGVYGEDSQWQDILSAMTTPKFRSSLFTVKWVARGHNSSHSHMVVLAEGRQTR